MRNYFKAARGSDLNRTINYSLTEAVNNLSAGPMFLQVTQFAITVPVEITQHTPATVFVELPSHRHLTIYRFT